MGARTISQGGVTEEKVWFSLVVVSVSGPMGADPHFYPSASEIRIQYRHMGCGGLKPAYFGAVPSFLLTFSPFKYWDPEMGSLVLLAPVVGPVHRHSAALTERDGPTALWDHQEGSLSHSKVKPEGGALCVGKARHGKAIRVFHILATVESHQGNAGTAGRSSPGIHPTSAFCAGSV